MITGIMLDYWIFKYVCVHNLIGEVGAKEMGNTMDEKTKTVAMSTTTTTTGKLSSGDTNVWSAYSLTRFDLDKLSTVVLSTYQ